MNFAQDFPKIHAPFVREQTDDGYLATPEINKDDDGNSYAWVVEDENVVALEKLDGTNVSLVIQDGHVTGVWNRTQRVPAWSTDACDQYLADGIRNAMDRGYVSRLGDGQHFGELVGPKIQGNPYELDERVWLPFSYYSRRRLRYESWGNYSKSFEAIKGWFEQGLIPLFYSQWHGCSFDEAQEQDAYTEGIIFQHTKPEEIDTLPFAKVRHDMFTTE